jgi:hypothetical protein
MATKYSQNLTFKDIFNDKRLMGKIPLINYKEKQLDNGKTSYRTHARTVTKIVYDTSVVTARKHYKPLEALKTGDIITIGGTLIDDLQDAVDDIYDALVAKRLLILWTANNGDIIRSALKESEKNKRLYGINNKLYLRAQSLQQIENMNNRQLLAFLGDVMNNIFYSGNFPATAKKYDIENLKINSQLSFKEREARWKEEVGDY